MKNTILTPFGATPNERQLLHYSIGKKAFFHVGINTFTDVEHGNGKEDSTLFAPTDADVDSWVKTARDAGFGLAILVCKHHDGFCLWPTASTEHCIRNSPYRDGQGDMVREFADACKKYGLYMGVYLSLWDMHTDLYGTPAYNDYYITQLTELLTNYGPIHEVWWDGCGSVGGNLDVARYTETVRRLQPDAAIFGALGAADFVDLRWCGNEAGKVADTHYASIDRDMIRVEDNYVLNRGTYGASAYVPAEVDTSIRPGWFYHPSQDGKVKSEEVLNRLWFSSVGRNAHMLLNFPVDRRGRIPDTDRAHAIASHETVSRMLATDFVTDAFVCADSVYDEQHAPAYAKAAAEGFYVSADTTAVLHITLPEEKTVNVLDIGEEVTLGERIASLTLEAIGEDGGARILCEATSVGYRRAVLFDACTVRRLRLTLHGQACPTVRTLSLRFFDGSIEDPATARGANLVASPEARVTVAEDRCSAVLNFGGIYPFRKVTCRVGGMGRFTIEAFDGFSFYRVYEGYALSEEPEVFLDEEIDGSYQIRIVTERPFADDPAFYVG